MQATVPNERNSPNAAAAGTYSIRSARETTLANSFSERVQRSGLATARPGGLISAVRRATWASTGTAQQLLADARPACPAAQIRDRASDVITRPQRSLCDKLPQRTPPPPPPSHPPQTPQPSARQLKADCACCKTFAQCCKLPPASLRSLFASSARNRRAPRSEDLRCAQATQVSDALHHTEPQLTLLQIRRLAQAQIPSGQSTALSTRAEPNPSPCYLDGVARARQPSKSSATQRPNDSRTDSCGRFRFFLHVWSKALHHAILTVSLSSVNHVSSLQHDTRMTRKLTSAVDFGLASCALLRPCSFAQVPRCCHRHSDFQRRPGEYQ